MVNISIPSWIMKQIIGNPKNMSQRIQELIIKGGFYEKEEQYNESNNKNKSEPAEIHASYPNNEYGQIAFREGTLPT